MSFSLTPDLDTARQLVEDHDALTEDADFFDLRLNDPADADRWTEVLTLAALGHVVNISFVDTEERPYNEDFATGFVVEGHGMFLEDGWRVCQQTAVVDVSTTARKVTDPVLAAEKDSVWSDSVAAVTESVNTAAKSSKRRRCGAVVRIQRAVHPANGEYVWFITTHPIVRAGLNRYKPFTQYERLVGKASAASLYSVPEMALGHLGLGALQSVSFIGEVDNIVLLTTADRLLALAGDDDDSEISIVRTTPVAPSAGAGLAEDEDSESVLVKRRASTPAPAAAAPLSLDDDEIVIRR